MPRSRKPGLALAAALAGFALAGPASSQLLGRGLGGVIGGIDPGVALGRVASDVPTLAADAQQLAQARLRRLEAEARAHPRELDLDSHGNVVVRGAVLAISPSVEGLAKAAQAGFIAEPPAAIEGLDLTVVTLHAPRGLSTRAALSRLRVLDPSGAYDLDPIYAPSAASASPVIGACLLPAPQPGRPVRVGMIDGGVDIHHAAFAGVAITQAGFAPGGVVPTAHGTAVASLIAGRDRAFLGAAPGAPLSVADVYGDGPAGGAGDMVVRGLAWTAGQGARVINVSLVGPPNAALAAAVRALQARGVILVAPVGNDGPAAPPAYPAAYPGVVAVTGVDLRGRVLIEAGRVVHLDFAAPAADLAAAMVGGGYQTVRGTSFASPIVTGRLAEIESRDGAASSAAIDDLAKSARGGERWGRGLVGSVDRCAAGR